MYVEVGKREELPHRLVAPRSMSPGNKLAQISLIQSSKDKNSTGTGLNKCLEADIERVTDDWEETIQALPHQGSRAKHRPKVW